MLIAVILCKVPSVENTYTIALIEGVQCQNVKPLMSNVKNVKNSNAIFCFFLFSIKNSMSISTSTFKKLLMSMSQFQSQCQMLKF